MGQTAGKMKGVFRPVKNYNIEERAFREISKEKPRAAPVHASMKARMDEIKRDPELLKRGKMDPKTMDHLSKVFLKSEGDNPQIQPSNRKLPQDRTSRQDYEYGYEEPASIPLGKASMRQVLEILSKHQTEPNVHTPEKLAAEYKLDLVETSNILSHFKPFDVILPKKKEDQPRLNPARLLQQKIDQLKDQSKQ